MQLCTPLCPAHYTERFDSVCSIVLAPILQQVTTHNATLDGSGSAAISFETLKGDRDLKPGMAAAKRALAAPAQRVAREGASSAAPPEAPAVTMAAQRGVERATAVFGDDGRAWARGSGLSKLPWAEACWSEGGRDVRGRAALETTQLELRVSEFKNAYSGWKLL